MGDSYNPGSHCSWSLTGSYTYRLPFSGGSMYWYWRWSFNLTYPNIVTAHYRLISWYIYLNAICCFNVRLFGWKQQTLFFRARGGRESFLDLEGYYFPCMIFAFDGKIGFFVPEFNTTTVHNTCAFSRAQRNQNLITLCILSGWTS